MVSFIRPGADRPAMLDAPAELIEERPRLRGVGFFRADEADELALPRRPGGAADRALDEGGAFGAHLLRKRDLDLRPHRAHLDEQLAGHVRGEEAAGPGIDLIDRRGIGEDGDDHVDRARERCRACGSGGARSDDRLGLCRGRFHTVTWLPVSMRRSATAAPILPSPATPTCMRPSSCQAARTIGDRVGL
jgi:hypothetical protein